MVPITNLIKYNDLLRGHIPTQTLAILHYYISVQTRYVSTESESYYGHTLIIASTFPAVITAGNLEASSLHCLSILFTSTSEKFSEGVILSRRLRFCQIFINDGANLNLLYFVAF